MDTVITTIYKESQGEYVLPKDSTVIYVFSRENILPPTSYSVNDDKVTVFGEFNSDIKITHRNSKHKILGYTGDHIYSLIGDSLLENNYVYDICTPINRIELSTKLYPLHCSIKDVKRILGPIIDYIGDDIDMDEYIYESSIEIDSMKVDNSIKKKLCSYKVAVDIAYHYYYKMINDAGKNEDTVGTLKVVREKKAFALSEFIKRFEKVVESLSTGSIIKSKKFVKANQSQYPIGSRIW